LIGCALLLIASGLRGRRRPDGEQAAWLAPLPWVGSRRHVAAFVAIVATTIAYILLADRVGFLIVAPIALFLMFVAFGESPFVSAAVAVVATALVWYAFYKLLRVPLPWGVLERFAF